VPRLALARSDSASRLAGVAQQPLDLRQMVEVVA
jgi:hypothetical protein